MTERVPPPVAKLNPVTVVRELNASLGTAIEVVGLASGGEVGAAYVRWPDGREGVLTQNDAGITVLEQTASLLRLARTHRIPCPRYELIHELPSGTVIVQERLPGESPRQVDDRLILAMLAMNDRFAGVLSERSDVPVLDLYLDRSGPGFCLHETLRAYGECSRRLLAWVHAIGQSSAAKMTGPDLVHADFHPGNVLIDEAGDITGIVDWDGIGRGDRRFGLVTLAFDLAWGVKFSPRYVGVTAEGMAAVWKRLDAIEPDIFRAYWAHMSLRLVDWSIRHHPPDVIDHYLNISLTRVDSENGSRHL